MKNRVTSDFPILVLQVDEGDWMTSFFEDPTQMECSEYGHALESVLYCYWTYLLKLSFKENYFEE